MNKFIKKLLQPMFESTESIESKKKFGVFIGRMQPFHKGHQEIINEILLDGLIPIIVLGSSNADRNLHKNPLTYAQRKELIRLVYPNVPIVFVRGTDAMDWDVWFKNLTAEIKTVLYREFDDDVQCVADVATLYFHNKEVDRCTFIFDGVEYQDAFYTEAFSSKGFSLKPIKFVKRDDIKIDSNARDIRDNLENMKHLLDARCYSKLKEWGW